MTVLEWSPCEGCLKMLVRNGEQLIPTYFPPKDELQLRRGSCQQTISWEWSSHSSCQGGCNHHSGIIVELSVLAWGKCLHLTGIKTHLWEECSILEGDLVWAEVKITKFQKHLWKNQRKLFQASPPHFPLCPPYPINNYRLSAPWILAPSIVLFPLSPLPLTISPDCGMCSSYLE